MKKEKDEKQIITKLTIQKEALPKAIKNKKATVVLSMGVGKTYLGLQYLSCLNYLEKRKLKTLVVAPKKEIIKSWKEEAFKFKLTDLIEDIVFTTYLSLSKQENNYDIIILDECHSLLYSHNDYLKKHNGRILGLTGTPPRNSNSEKGIMVENHCPVVYSYITKEAVEDKILNNYKIYVHYLDLNNEKNIQINYKNGNFITSEILNYNYWTNRVDDAKPGKSKQIASVMRMKAMMDYSSKELYAKQLFEKQVEKCILFCNTQSQADKLCNYSYHSNNPKSEENLIMFKNGNISKLSCVLQLNEGVNIPNLKVGIIMHSYGNERKSSQRIGRLLRLNPKETAIIHILCYKNTVDDFWVKSALKDFDQLKINYINE
jgi:superfamily II DNA or RNA helicase